MSYSVDLLSNLCKIKFSEEELLNMEQDMQSIMNLMDSIKTVDLPKVEEDVDFVKLNDLRKDEVVESMDTDLLISQCKVVRNGGFTIPKIVE